MDGSGGGRRPAGAHPESGRLPEAGGPGTGSRGTGARPGFGESPGAAAAGGRGGERGAGGYGPMGGAGAGSQGGQEHRNRYLVVGDEVFAVPVAGTDPVLGPEEDDRR